MSPSPRTLSSFHFSLVKRMSFPKVIGGLNTSWIGLALGPHFPGKADDSYSHLHKISPQRSQMTVLAP